MPVRPKKPCRHPGCANLTNSKFCDTHKSLHPEVTRSASKRGYNYKWQKASRAYLSKHSLCEECLRDKRYTQATVVDHVIPHRGNGKLFWDKNNWRALCKPCHDHKTGKMDSIPTYGY